jgi:cytochrome c1
MEKAMRRLLSLGCLALLFQSGCAFYHEKNPGNPSTVIPGTVTWGQVYFQVIQPRCAICHSMGGAGFNCSNYQSVVSMINQVQDRAITKQSMPTDSPLTPYETALLQAWIAEGYPNGGGGP